MFTSMLAAPGNTTLASQNKKFTTSKFRITGGNDDKIGDLWSVIIENLRQK